MKTPSDKTLPTSEDALKIKETENPSEEKETIEETSVEKTPETTP